MIQLQHDCAMKMARQIVADLKETIPSSAQLQAIFLLYQRIKEGLMQYENKMEKRMERLIGPHSGN